MCFKDKIRRYERTYTILIYKYQNNYNNTHSPLKRTKQAYYILILIAPFGQLETNCFKENYLETICFICLPY
jgi:hypothetical protein